MANKKPTLNWVSILGNAHIAENEISFYSAPGIYQSGNEGALVVVKSDKVFQAGRIECEIKLQSSKDRAQFILNHGLADQVFIGLNYAGIPFGIGINKGGAWTPIITNGFGSIVETNKWHRVMIEVNGSSITMSFNGVEVLAAQVQIQAAQLALLLQIVSTAEDGGAAEVARTIAVRNIVISGVRSKVFAVMQFTPEFNALFKQVIKPICEEFGYEVIRADDIFNNGLIISDITQSIKDSAVVIADITPNNANVFYEVGYAHALGKPTILLSDKVRDRLPFDVSGFRTLFYDNTIAGKEAIETSLRKHLENLPQGKK